MCSLNAMRVIVRRVQESFPQACLWARFWSNASSQVRLTPAGASRPARRGRRQGGSLRCGARWAGCGFPAGVGRAGPSGPDRLGCSCGGRGVGCDPRGLGFRFRKALRAAAWLRSAPLPQLLTECLRRAGPARSVRGSELAATRPQSSGQGLFRCLPCTGRQPAS